MDEAPHGCLRRSLRIGYTWGPLSSPRGAYSIVLYLRLGTTLYVGYVRTHPFTITQRDQASMSNAYVAPQARGKYYTVVLAQAP